MTYFSITFYLIQKEQKSWEDILIYEIKKVIIHHLIDEYHLFSLFCLIIKFYATQFWDT